MKTDISILIVSFNTRDRLRECLKAVAAQTGDIRIETIVVDNASHDGSAEMVLAEFPAVILVRSELNLGFGNGNNLGLQQAHGRYLVLLNSDALLPQASKPWAQAFDDAVKKALATGALEALMDYQSLDASYASAVPTPDHYWPMLYALGAAGFGEKPVFTFEGFQNGTISMRCMQWG